MIPNSNSSNNEATTLMNENDQFMCGVVEGVFNFICDRQQGRISTLTIFDKSFDVKKLTIT